MNKPIIPDTKNFIINIAFLSFKNLFEKKFWEVLRKKEATTFGGVPFIFEILKKLKKVDLDFIFV